MSWRILLVVSFVIGNISAAEPVVSPPASTPSNPEIDQIKGELNQRLRTLADLKDELKDLEADFNDSTEMTATPRRTFTVEALRKEVSSLEGDTTNLVKDGFEENHPRVLALRSIIAHKKHQIIQLEAEEALRKSLPQVIKQEQTLIDALTLHLQQATANTTPSAPSH